MKASLAYKVHFPVGGNIAMCGTVLDDLDSSTDWQEVTCKRCISKSKPNSMFFPIVGGVKKKAPEQDLDPRTFFEDSDIGELFEDRRHESFHDAFGSPDMANFLRESI